MIEALPCPACGAPARVSARLAISSGDTGWFLIECERHRPSKGCLSLNNLPSSLNGRKQSAIREWNRVVRAQAVLAQAPTMKGKA